MEQRVESRHWVIVLFLIERAERECWKKKKSKTKDTEAICQNSVQGRGGRGCWLV